MPKQSENERVIQSSKFKLTDRISPKKLFVVRRVKAATSKDSMQITEEPQDEQTHCVTPGLECSYPDFFTCSSVVTRPSTPWNDFCLERGEKPSLRDTIASNEIQSTAMDEVIPVSSLKVS